MGSLSSPKEDDRTNTLTLPRDRPGAWSCDSVWHHSSNIPLKFSFFLKTALTTLSNRREYRLGETVQTCACSPFVGLIVWRLQRHTKDGSPQREMEEAAGCSQEEAEGPVWSSNSVWDFLHLFSFFFLNSGTVGAASVKLCNFPKQTSTASLRSYQTSTARCVGMGEKAGFRCLFQDFVFSSFWLTNIINLYLNLIIRTQKHHSKTAFARKIWLHCNPLDLWLWAGTEDGEHISKPHPSLCILHPILWFLFLLRPVKTNRSGTSFISVPK